MIFVIIVIIGSILHALLINMDFDTMQITASFAELFWDAFSLILFSLALPAFIEIIPKLSKSVTVQKNANPWFVGFLIWLGIVIFKTFKIYFYDKYFT